MTSNSRFNFIIDSLKFDKNRSIRKKILKIIAADQKTFDYGNGYFYQSCEKINLSGLRKSKKRADILNLEELTLEKKVLDIGTNTGFLLFEMNNNFNFCDAIDWNPTLIKTANEVKEYLGLDKITFFSEDFMTFDFNKIYDVVLSLANHTTYDGGIDNYKTYFEKINKILCSNGYLILESHHPSYEKPEKFSEIINYLGKTYKIEKNFKYKFNNYADDKREVFFLKKKL